MQQAIQKRFGHDGAAREETYNTPHGGVQAWDRNGVACGNAVGDVIPQRLWALTMFALLPAAAVAAGTDSLVLTSGTGTEVVARASKGGINIKTQATTPADNDTVLIAGVATTGFVGLINAATNLRFATRVSLTAITTLFASIGLNENITDADPTGTAGEGAMFLFAPGGPGTTELTVDTGLTLAQHANWILAHKVNGADTFTATAIPVVAGQDYELAIEIDGDLKANYYIDGVLVGQGPALTSGDSVSVFGGVEATTTPGGQRDMDVRYLKLSRAIG